VGFGWISAIAAIIGVGLVLTRRRGSQWLGGVVIVAGVDGILVSGTRSAVPLLVIGLIILQFGVRSARSSMAFLLLGLMGLSLSLVGIGGNTEVGRRLEGNVSSQASDQGRGQLRRQAITVVREHGFTGVGLRYLYPPHNLILGVLGATGIIGFTGLLVIVATLARRFATTPDGDVVALAVLSATLAIYVSSWVINPGWDRFLWYPLALVFAMPRYDDGNTSGEEKALAHAAA